MEINESLTYNEAINLIISTRGQWSEEIKNSGLCERHHILPRSLGGLPEKLNWKPHENVIWVTYKEHFILHKILYHENPSNKKLFYGYHMMAFPKGKSRRDYEISPEEYSELRIKSKELISGENNPMKNQIPWNKGLTKKTSTKILEYGKKVSQTKKGVSRGPLSEEVKLHMSVSQYKRYQEKPWTFTGRKKGNKCITNGKINYFIKPTDNIPEGFTFGMTNFRKRQWKDPELISKQRSIKTSGKNNPMFGKGYKLSGGKNGHATIRYYYKDLVFESRIELIEYLSSIGIKITESGIRLYMKNGLTDRLKTLYGNTLLDITWKCKNEDKENNQNNIR